MNPRLTFVRFSRIEPFTPHKFPRGSGQTCLLCGDPITGPATLIPLGPGDSIEDRRKASTGRYFNAVALEVCWDCHTGEED